MSEVDIDVKILFADYTAKIPVDAVMSTRPPMRAV